MSQEYVDDFLEGAEALNRGDMERALEGYDEDVVFEPQASEVEGAFVGPDGVKEFMTGLVDLYECSGHTSRTFETWVTGCWRSGR